jgi:hypothetical protein
VLLPVWFYILPPSPPPPTPLTRAGSRVDTKFAKILQSFYEILEIFDEISNSTE